MLYSMLISLTMLVPTAGPALQQHLSPPAQTPAASTQEQPAAQAEETEQGQTSIAGKTVSYRIRRLPLSAFPELPPSVRTALEQRHCRVPQTYQARRPENVIHGHFRDKNTDDWAVLCSAGGMTSLLVLNGSTNGSTGGQPAEFPPHRDLDRLAPATPSGDMFGYNWAIDTASPTRLRELSGHQSIPFDHDGIEDSTIERSATIRYYQGGEWMAFDRSE